LTLDYPSHYSRRFFYPTELPIFASIFISREKAPLGFQQKNMKNSINIPSSVADIPSFIETHWEAPKPRPGLQHWRAILSRSKGSLVSSNVAPATAAASVVSNKSFALAYKGANHGENDDFSTENGDSTGENDDFIRENNDFTGENGDFTREHDDFMKEHGGAMVS
jgi:hypothetical protein